MCAVEIKNNECGKCHTKLSPEEWTELKAHTMDDLMTHLYNSRDCERKRERLRVKIAFKNIKKWSSVWKEAIVFGRNYQE